MTVQGRPLQAALPEQLWRGAVWFAVLVTAALPIWWLGLQALFQAWSTPEYSHGPIIPAVSLFLFLRELRVNPPAPADTPANRWPGLALILFALGIGIFGNVVQIPDIITYGLILWVGGIMLVCLGWAQGRRHWAPVLHLVFMLPLPQFVYWQLSLFLQGISSELGVWFLGLTGVPVYLDGNIIDLGVWQLQVAEACSGLRYLFPILSFSYLFAILYRGPVWHKAVLLLAAAPLAVLMNSVRIAGIGVMVDRYGIAHAEGFLHAFEGWVIFLACISILFGMAVGLQRLTRHPKPLAEVIDVDTSGFAASFARLPGVAASVGLIAASIASVIVAAAFILTPMPQPLQPDRDPFALFPRGFGEWLGQTQALEPEVAAVLGADDYINASYEAPAEAGIVNLFVAYYDRQAAGSGIHSPAVCLPVGGWEVAAITAHAVDMSATPYGVFNVNRTIIQKGNSRQLVYYWFEQRGRRMTNDYAAKATVIWDALTRGRSDGALVRFVTPIDPGETDADAEERLQRFMALALKRLPRFVPE
jgi:exosortase D (VPLPA-CTERM-specific)